MVNAEDRIMKVCLTFLLLVLNFSLFYSCQFFDVDAVETDFSPSSSSGLPALYINIDDRCIHSTYDWLKNARYAIKDEAGLLLKNGTLDIRGRGNSTWKMLKKPYSINLSDSCGLFGMPPNKRWNLLANYADKSLLRTETAFQLGRIFNGLSWTPHSDQIDLYINGEYRGVYQCTEAIGIDENRVKIDKITPEMPENGYILEADWRMGEKYHFTTKMGVVFCCTDPDDCLEQTIHGDTISLFEKMETDFQHVEDVLYSNTFRDSLMGYRPYLDLPSVIDWYFVNEITKNVDAQFGLSVFLYYDNVKRKYCMGPLWDFDYALGNVDYANSRYSTGFWVKNSYLISRLFEDPYFVKAVKTRWLEKRDETYGIFSFIHERAKYLERAQAFNFQKWRILDKQVASGAFLAGDYNAQVDTIEKWLKERLDWLDVEINKL
jgi:hypothetical protein